MILFQTVSIFLGLIVLLSILVQALTWMIQSNSYYYADCLETEVEHFLRETLDTPFDNIEDIKGVNGKKVLENIPWNQLGEEFFSVENMKELVEKIAGHSDFKYFEARVKRHQVHLKTSFNDRMSSLTLVCGVGLCLFLNINALTIWKTVYADSQTREKIASADYIAAVLKKNEELEYLDEKKSRTAGEKAEGTEQREGTRANKEELAKDREAWKKELVSIQTHANFGIGAVWENGYKDLPNIFFFFEFLGSLLTGILISIGGPFFQSILTNVTNRILGRSGS